MYDPTLRLADQEAKPHDYLETGAVLDLASVGPDSRLWLPTVGGNGTLTTICTGGRGSHRNWRTADMAFSVCGSVFVFQNTHSGRNEHCACIDLFFLSCPSSLYSECSSK